MRQLAYWSRLGCHDLDVLYEPATRSISSQQQQRPVGGEFQFYSIWTRSIHLVDNRQVEKIRLAGQREDIPTTALRSIMCSGCTSFIRSSKYFECCRGCEEQWVLCSCSGSWLMTEDMLLTIQRLHTTRRDPFICASHPLGLLSQHHVDYATSV